jgi:uncharacterized membrane protein YqaE (UPF0057 family)
VSDISQEEDRVKKIKNTIWSFYNIFSETFKELRKMSTATFVDIIIAILLPPLGVFLRFGCGVEFWICLVLTLLGYIPGIIYAIYVLTKWFTIYHHLLEQLFRRVLLSLWLIQRFFFFHQSFYVSSNLINHHCCVCIVI